MATEGAGAAAEAAAAAAAAAAAVLEVAVVAGAVAELISRSGCCRLARAVPGTGVRFAVISVRVRVRVRVRIRVEVRVRGRGRGRVRVASQGGAWHRSRGGGSSPCAARLACTLCTLCTLCTRALGLHEGLLAARREG